MLSHERLQDVDVDAMADVKKGAVLDLFLNAASINLLVHIKIQVQVISAILHAPNLGVRVEGGPSALAT